MENNKKSDYKIDEIDCPSCIKNKAKVVTHILDIPYYDDFASVSIHCTFCGYRINDFHNLESKGHLIYRYNVESEKDFTTKIVRSRNGIIRIQEIGVKIEPSGDGTSWIRNIEGVLEDIRQKIKITLDQFEDVASKRAAKKRLKKLKQLQNYEIPFVIEIEDQYGNSLILPANESNLEIIVVNEAEPHN